MKGGFSSASILFAKTKMIFILQGSRSKAKGSSYDLFLKLVQCQYFLVYLKSCSRSDSFYFKCEMNFWNVYGIMNASGLSFHDSINIP